MHGWVCCVFGIDFAGVEGIGMGHAQAAVKNKLAWLS